MELAVADAFEDVNPGVLPALETPSGWQAPSATELDHFMRRKDDLSCRGGTQVLCIPFSSHLDIYYYKRQAGCRLHEVL